MLSPFYPVSCERLSYFYIEENWTEMLIGNKIVSDK